LSAGRFARALAVEPGTYRRYERGEMEPALTTLTKLRRVTGVCLCRLVCGEAAGDDKMIPAFVNNGTTLGDRIRWVRELLAPDVAEFAQTMQVPLAEWRLWEIGATQPDIEKIKEFAQRCDVTLDFLFFGRVDGLSPRLHDHLQAAHPELLSSPDRAAVPNGHRGLRSDNTAPPEPSRRAS